MSDQPKYNISVITNLPTGTTSNIVYYNNTDGTLSYGEFNGVDINSFNTYTGTTVPNTYVPLIASIIVVSGTTYTLSASDGGKIIEFINTGATTITLPSGTTTSVGFQAILSNIGGGIKTVVAEAGGGNILHSLNDLNNITGAYNGGTVYYRQINEWVLYGNLS